MSIEHLESQLESWHRKPGLRFVYTDWFREIEQWLKKGRSFEIGSGIGRIKEYLGDITTIDVMRTPWTDIVGDAEMFPIKDDSTANLILFDVLHHLPRPTFFFKEAFRVLENGGRLIIADPYISIASSFIYKYFHPEPVDMNCDPFEDRVPLSSKEPFDSNQAVATVLFNKRLQTWKNRFSGLSVIFQKRYGFFAYPATGGFGGKTLLPYRVIRWIQRNEKYLTFFSRLLAFRLLIVIEKNANGK